jgi:hypothetical protein
LFETRCILWTKGIFSEDEIKRFTDLHNELMQDCALILLEIILGREDYQKRMHESKIQRAKEVMKFAFIYAKCPENLDAFFRETQINKKARDLNGNSKLISLLIASNIAMTCT